MRHTAAVLLGAIVAIAALSSSAGAQVPDDGVAHAGQVLELLQAKCNTCHGSHLERPKGRFGYVLDLPRIAANIELIEPGDAEISNLFIVMEEGSMPPRKSGIPAVTADELAAVRSWIEAGAPPASAEKLAAMNLGAVRPVSGGSAASALPLIDRLVEYAGRFHAAGVHFPIALLFAAAMAELLGAWKKTDAWHITVRYCVWFGAIAALLSTALGWANASYGTAVGDQADLIELHRWVGTVSSIFALLAIVAVERRRKHPCKATSTLLRVLLFILVVGMSASGFLGGAIIKGINHYAW